MGQQPARHPALVDVGILEGTGGKGWRCGGGTGQWQQTG